MNSKEFSLHEFSFFVDKDVVLNSIQILCDESKSEQWDSALEIYQSSLSKYQEQPILLNSSLEELMSPLSEQLVKLSLDIAESLDTTVIYNCLFSLFICLFVRSIYFIYFLYSTTNTGFDKI